MEGNGGGGDLLLVLMDMLRCCCLFKMRMSSGRDGSFLVRMSYCGLSGWGGPPVSLCRLLFMILRGWILAGIVDSDVRAIVLVSLSLRPLSASSTGKVTQCLVFPGSNPLMLETKEFLVRA